MTISTEGSLALPSSNVHLSNPHVHRRTPLIRLHTWNIFNKVISLHLKGHAFMYHVVDQQTGADEGWGGLDHNPAMTTKDRSLKLIKTLPIIKNNDLDFAHPHQCHEIMLLGYKVHLLLLETDKSIFWRFIDEPANESFCYPFDPASVTSLASQNTVGIFKNPRRHSQRFLISALSEKQIGIHYQQSTLDPRTIDLKLLRVRPLESRSRIDPRVSISPFQWAVTLVAYGGSVGHCSCLSKGNHAQLIVEGIDEEGKPFVKMIHHTGPQGVKVEPLTDKSKVLFGERSMIWKKPAWRVQKLINQAKQDETLGPALGFNIFGEKSFLYITKGVPGAHNCFSYSRDRLKLIDVHLKNVAFEWIAVKTKSFTKKAKAFKQLTASCSRPEKV
ncbi:MAG: hypothetical protein ACSNEK_09690 [Parachlamydiaceae bacterium]